MLVLANRLPFPVDDGWKARTYHIIRGLARYSEVTLLVFHPGEPETIRAFRRSVPDGVEVVTVPPPPAYTLPQLIAGLVTRTPVFIWRLRSRAFASALHRLTLQQTFDVAVSQLTYMYPYLRALPRSTRRVIDTHNVDSVVLRRYAAQIPGRLRRWYAALTARKLRSYEARVFADADLVWVCSEQELPVVRELAPAATVRVVENGVDTRAFSPLEQPGDATGSLVFFGRMDYIPNLDAVRHFAAEILPRLKTACPGLELAVVGAGINDELRGLAASEPAIRLVGRVDDLRPVLADAAAVVVPLRMGGGTRLKILEALSMGKAVISTTVGAEGLDLQPGRDLLIADEAGDFASAVCSVLSDRELRERLGSAGRRAVQERYDWEQIEGRMAQTLGW